MHSIQESLSEWATVLATALNLLGLIQSRSWLIIFSLIFGAVAVTATLDARRSRASVSSALIEVEGRKIDSLNAANLSRRANSSLFVQRAHHLATIDGAELTMKWKYKGFCRGGGETSVEFSIDAESGRPLAEIDCLAYDLVNDPAMRQPIQPLLVGPEGISKKIAVPLLVPLKAGAQFDLLLTCKIPDCISTEVGYYASTLSFHQSYVPAVTTCLRFKGKRPRWVRVYDCKSGERAALRKSLGPYSQNGEFCEYVDSAQNVSGKSAMVYLFSRSGHSAGAAPSASG